MSSPSDNRNPQDLASQDKVVLHGVRGDVAYTLPQLSQLSWDALYGLRKDNPSPEMQSLLGPLEHRAYARMEVSRDPANAVAQAVMIPDYTAYKAVVGHARSPVSFSEIVEGYRGIGEGLELNAERKQETAARELLSSVDRHAPTGGTPMTSGRVSDPHLGDVLKTVESLKRPNPCEVEGDLASRLERPWAGVPT